MTAWARLIIVDYKSGQHLQNCVDALIAQTFTDFTVKIIDNDCPEKASQSLTGLDGRFEVIINPENSGYAGGCNFGARGAKTPWLIMLNPDTIAKPDWLENLHAASQVYPDTDMFSTTLVTAGDPQTIDGFGDVISIYGLAWRGGHGQNIHILPDEDRRVFSPCGAASMYKTCAFNAVGGFDEDFFCYIEDIDLGWRLRLNGVDCVQVRHAICEHFGSVSTAGNPNFRYYHSARNTIWMIIKCAPFWLLPIMLSLNIFSYIYLCLRGAYKGTHSVRGRGIRDGLRQFFANWAKRKSTKPNRCALLAMAWLSVSPKALRRQTIRSRSVSGSIPTD